MMRALQFEEVGDPLTVLRLAELPLPEPARGSVRLRMLLRPINPSDLLQVKGVYGRRPALPAIAGLEGLGVVEALGEGVEGLKVGQRVVPLGAQGTWADYLVTNAENLARIPDGVPDEVAAQAVVNPLTAWILTVEELQLREGDWLVQTAAGSSVGRCVIQIAKARGFRTLNLVRRPEQVQELLEQGGDAVLCTGEEGWLHQAEAILGPSGAAAGVDAVGGTLAGQVAMLLRRGATMAVYGALSMEPLRIPGGQMIFRTLNLRGFWLSDWKLNAPKTERDRVLGELLEALRAGVIVPPVEGIFPLERFSEALARAGESGRSGKVLLA
jgi:NADPH:quinone reductase-like Zn-dependent oxidoreductase